MVEIAAERRAETEGGPDRAIRPPAAELIISGLLRYGVLLSLGLVALGVLLLLVSGPAALPGGFDAQALRSFGGAQGAFWPTTAGGVVNGALAGQPLAVILLGLLLLIATPVLRVIVSTIVFVAQHDLAYVVITLLVLGILVLSFLLGSR